jgi:hypothetical protein
MRARGGDYLFMIVIKMFWLKIFGQCQEWEIQTNCTVVVLVSESAGDSGAETHKPVPGLDTTLKYKRRRAFLSGPAIVPA